MLNLINIPIEYKIPEMIMVNGRKIYFSDMVNIQDINEYLTMIDKLQWYT